VSTPTPASPPVKDRLFRGYGPLIGFTALFLAIALLVPSQQREVRIESVDDTELDGARAGTLGDDEFEMGELTDEELEALEALAEAEVLGAGAAGGGSRGGSGAGAAGGGAGGGGGTASGGGGGAAGTGPANVGGCDDRPLQVPSDPYSPPCMTFSGDNGGATSRGVTADKIVVSVRADGFSNGMLDALSRVAKAKIPSESPEVIARTINGLVEYFNRTFQFYGRKLEVRIYNGKGDLLKEITGGGQEAAQADALQVAQEFQAFADVSAVTPVYADALARRGVINIGAPFMSRQWLSQRRPYVWTQFTDCSTVVESVSSYYAIKMAGKPAQHARGPLQNQPRKVGIIAPENSWYQECVGAGIRILNSAGVQPALNEKYRLDINQMSIQAGEKMAKLKNAGITTVMCGCDPLFMTFLTAKAREQNYHPEWLVTGVALMDNDLIGSIMEQGQWSRAFGVSFAGQPAPAGRGQGYRAYKAVRSDEPSFGVELIYNQLNLLAIGVQMAGPNLTPESFEQGMFRYPNRSGPAGTWGFGPNNYSTTQDAREVFWNPQATSIETRERGAYVDPNNGQRFPIGRWTGAPPRAAG